MHPEPEIESRTGWKRSLLCLVAIVLLVGIAVGTYRLTRSLIGDDQATGYKPESEPTETITTLPKARCGSISTADDKGTPLSSFWFDQVSLVHEAACQRDYLTLTNQMDGQFQGATPEAVMTRWLDEDPADAHMALLAATLETPGRLFQGGLLYCHKSGAAAVFARGVQGVYGGWTDFDIAGEGSAGELCG